MSKGSERIDTASRVIRANAPAVYRAFIEPEAVKRWLPPRGMRCEIHAFVPQPGGAYDMTLFYEDAQGAPGKTAADADTVRGRFVELLANRRIVQQVEFQSDDDAFAGTMTTIWSLASTADGTEVTVRCENVPPGISKADHDAGLASTLDNLAACVEGRQPRA